MEVTIRPAVPGDASRLVAHLKTLAAEPGINIPMALDEVATVEDERARLETFEDHPRALVLVAERDGELLGELTIRAISPRRAVAHVASLGMSVRADARGQGVGTALLESAIEWAKTAGIIRIELYVYARNAPAIALYEKAGFVTEGTRRAFIKEGDEFLDDLVMGLLIGR
ncbi:MAG TPA: GNAT family N-acetyltransferase [Kofleriaceae bacterium]